MHQRICAVFPNASRNTSIFLASGNLAESSLLFWAKSSAFPNLEDDAIRAVRIQRTMMVSLRDSGLLGADEPVGARSSIVNLFRCACDRAGCPGLPLPQTALP